MLNITLYQSTFGFKCMKCKNAVPIEVGADCRSEFIYSLKDNTGDNISAENLYFGELTGLYWIWKNAKLNSNIIGFCHYNKILRISDKSISKFLTENPEGWIVARPEKIPPHSKPVEWTTFCEVINDLYPECVPFLKKSFDALGGSNECYIANMFITTKQQFESYCKFAFDILFETRNRIGVVDSDKYNKRYCAFLGERLLTIYLATYDLKVHAVPIYHNKERFLVLRQLLKKTGIKKDGRLYKWLDRHFGRLTSMSSYKK